MKVLSTGFFLLALVNCSASSNATANRYGCVTHPAPQGVARFPPLHRATALICNLTTYGPPDAGGPCILAADCSPPSSTSMKTRCLNGACTWDGCITDADCAASEACTCGGFRSNGYVPNECTPAHCHVDSDCGPGGYCVPTGGYCGSTESYHCAKQTDPCIDPSLDCSCTSAGQAAPSAACVYNPTAGQFVCAQELGCAG